MFYQFQRLAWRGINRLHVKHKGRGVGAAAVPSVATPSIPLVESTSEPVTLALVQQLEKLSLVDVANKEGLRSLNYTISMADRLHGVNTEGVTPLVTLLEDRNLALADDVPEEVEDVAERKERLLACASDTLEDFFVVPPGNIDYIPDEDYYKGLMGEDKAGS